MPRWWVYVFYACIVWGIGYVIAYPVWPLINGATRGLLNSSMRSDLTQEINRFDAAVKDQLIQTPLGEIGNDPDLARFAQNAGASGVEGKGYPNLIDDDWLWGGDIEAIYLTINHGIRNTLDEDTRTSQMPRFGADGILNTDEIAATAEYVLSISDQEHNADLALLGATLFADNCAACHGDTGEGNRDLGAPRLNDAIWLYGGDRDAVIHSITYARAGVMSGWNTRLSEDEIRAVALYVHSRGGGE